MVGCYLPSYTNEEGKLVEDPRKEFAIELLNAIYDKLLSNDDGESKSRNKNKDK